MGETETGAFCFFDPSIEVIMIRDLTTVEKDEKLRLSVSVSGQERERDTATLFDRLLRK